MKRRTPKQQILTVFVLVSFFCFFAPVDCTASDAAKNISRIQNFYKTVKDLKGSFIQKNTIKDLDRTDVYNGEFLIKYPLKMRWMYKGKTPQEIIISGGSVIIYKKGDSQAYKGKFDRSTYGQSPVALLSGFEDITESFNITGSGDSLILKPKNPSGNISSIKLVMSGGDFPIQSFTIFDGNSNVVEIELKDIEINTGLKDSLFEFSLPEGVSIYEQ